MPTVRILAPGEPPFDIAAPDGGSLRDLCDDAGAPVPFNCRNANCGVCRVDIVSGGEFLLPPNDGELSLLDIFADDPRTRRLSCQAEIRAGAGELHLRLVPDE